jgi:hypothetical protein
MSIQIYKYVTPAVLKTLPTENTAATSATTATAQIRKKDGFRTVSTRQVIPFK